MTSQKIEIFEIFFGHKLGRIMHTTVREISPFISGWLIFIISVVKIKTKPFLIPVFVGFSLSRDSIDNLNI